MIAGPGPATLDMGQTSVSTLSPQPNSGESRGHAMRSRGAGRRRACSGQLGRSRTPRLVWLCPNPPSPCEKPERERSPKLFVVEKWNAFWDPADFTLKAQAPFSVGDASLWSLSELLLSLKFARNAICVLL